MAAEVSNPVIFLNVQQWTEQLMEWEGYNRDFNPTREFSIWKSAVGTIGHLALGTLSMLESICHLAMMIFGTIGSVFSNDAYNFFIRERELFKDAYMFTAFNDLRVMQNPVDCVNASLEYIGSFFRSEAPEV